MNEVEQKTQDVQIARETAKERDLEQARCCLDIWASVVWADRTDGRTPILDAIFERERKIWIKVTEERRAMIWISRDGKEGRFAPTVLFRVIDELLVQPNYTEIQLAPARVIALAVDRVLVDTGFADIAREPLLRIYPRTGPYARTGTPEGNGRAGRAFATGLAKLERGAVEALTRVRLRG